MGLLFYFLLNCKKSDFYRNFLDQLQVYNCIGSGTINREEIYIVQFRLAKQKQYNKGIMHKAVKAVLIAALAAPFLPFGQTAAQAAAEPTLQLKSEEIITTGAKLKTYVWQTERSGKSVSVNVNVIEVDLHNPYVKVDVMTGTDGQFTKKQTVLGMATENKAVGAINGDFYNTQYEGVPVGPQISDGELMATPPYLPGFYTFAITKDRKPVVGLFTLDTKSKVIAQDGASYTLSGINKTGYWYEPSGEHSMINGLYMYTNAWGQVGRANDGVTAPLEVLVVDNVVAQIASTGAPNYGVIDMIAPENGYILRSSGMAADFVREHVKVGDTLQVEYDVLPLDPTVNYDYKNFQMMIGGHTILVDQGQPSAFSRNIGDISGTSARSRTAVGYSQDERYVYLITADLSGESKGVTIPELQKLMVQIGVWKGINLDGGGSTQMVARPLGEDYLQIVNSLETGAQRQIVNALGVFSLAPKGQVKSLEVEGPDTLLLGEEAAYTLKGYDEYYNPVTGEDLQVNWSSASGLANTENTFTATQKGKAVITADAGTAKATKEIQVVGSEELASLKVEAYPSVLRAGATATLKVTAKLKSGATRELPPSVLDWEIRGIEGEITESGLRVDSVEGVEEGLLIARYDGYSTMTVLAIGETQTFADFDDLTLGVAFEGTAGVTGTAKRVFDSVYGRRIHGQLEYDFTDGTGTKAAYAVLGNKTAVIPGEPQILEIDINGDESLNWLRAEFVDADGDINRVDLARSINWTGWKTITVDLTSHNMTYPVKLTRLYAASVEEGQEQRGLTGAIGFDNIRFQYKKKAEALPRNQVLLTIDKPEILVNGEALTIDQAPVIVEGNTLVPIRFVLEALGGEVEWDDADRRVTIIRGQQMMEFRLGQKDYLADGVRKTAEVSPELRNERTMVPLRVLTEYLGWKVTWEESTRTVGLE